MVAIGSTLIAAGIGNLLIHGAGRRSITADGLCIPVVVGCGRLTEFGDRPGFHGGRVAIIAAGLPCPRTPSSMFIPVGGLMACASVRALISACGQTTLPSLPCAISTTTIL